MQQTGQYDFFMNQGATAGKVPMMGGGNSMKRRIILVVIGAVILIILAIVATQLLFNSKPDNAQQLLEIAQQQNELIRISGIGVEKARGTDAKNLAMTTKLSLSTDQQPLIDALAKQNIKAKPQLNDTKNSKTDALLDTAEQNNRFDDEFLKYLRTELASYQKKLNDAYKNTSSKSLKEAMKHQYQNASTLAGIKPED
jgi:flagellar basal body-associated protein FliL